MNNKAAIDLSALHNALLAREPISVSMRGKVFRMFVERIDETKDSLRGDSVQITLKFAAE